MELPKVSIVIANLNGKHHLRECFGSIKRLHYPKDKIEVIVVDNGSVDGSVELIEQKFGWVRLIRNSKNEGFAKPSNDGARAATGEYVAFINNDMRVQPDWLIELINSLRRNNAKCAGSVIMNWDGKLLDFAGGGVNFCGLGYQDDFQRPMTEMEPLLAQDKDILFACGGAMIVERKLFLFAGGFDEDYFAYYEDTDLGWRLRVMGCRIVLSVKSRVFHRHNSTSKTIAQERIQYLFERNKLYTCYKNYDDEQLYKVFLPSLLLQIREAYIYSGIDGFNYNIKNPGAFDSEQVVTSQRTAMKLSALNEFVEMISVMRKKRAFIQGNRKTSETEISKLVNKPFIIFLGDNGEFLNAEYDLVKAFGIDKILLNPLKTNVLLILGKNAGSDTGAAKHCLAISTELVKNDSLEVTAACPAGFEAAELGGAVRYSENDPVALMEAVRKSTVVVLLGQPLCKNPELLRAISKKYVVADISGISNSKIDDKKSGESHSGKVKAPNKTSEVLKKLIDNADFYICADEKQKEYLCGMMAALEIDAVQETTVVSDLKPLVDYCAAPRHTARMHSNGQDLLGGVLSESNGAQGTAGQGHVSVQEQLMRIEKQQTEIAQLIMSDRRMMKETHTGVKELKDWSVLMENRFFKLKHKLMGVRLLRRFVK